MRNKKTIYFAIFTLSFLLAVYVFDYRNGLKDEKTKQASILNYESAQISYIQITKPDIKIALQKNENGWALREPIQDFGDNDNIEELINAFANEKQISIIRESQSVLSEAELREFGLDKPAVVFNFKNNLGQTKNISVGSVKNFEGNSYLRIDSENKIIIAAPVWFLKSQNELIHYREKKLYRESLNKIVKIKAKSLSDDFELKYVDGKWMSSEYGFALDQNKVREILKKLSDTKIEQYIFEGEPSAALVKEKGLDKSTVQLELQTENSSWHVSINLNVADKSLYALTDRPTFLVKIDLSAWESFGNFKLDQLRDRTSALAFNLDEVQKLYYKHNENELNIVSSAGEWKASSTAAPAPSVNDNEVKKVIYRIHDLKISEFVDRPSEKEKFEGKNMLILRSATEKLVLQLNWGPSFKMNKSGEEKEYYFARSNLSDSTFAIEKNLIDRLDFEKISAAKQDGPGIEKDKIGAQIE